MHQIDVAVAHAKKKWKVDLARRAVVGVLVSLPANADDELVKLLIDQFMDENGYVEPQA